ncbi:MAG: hypothetical protein ACOYLK_16210, partial [Sphingomonas sp.]
MTPDLSRRSILSGLGLGASMLAAPAWARGQSVHGGHLVGQGGRKTLISAGFDEVSGEVINL